MGLETAGAAEILHGARKTVFLLDRSDSFIMYLRIVLERMGFRVVPLKKWKLLREMLPIVGADLVLLGTTSEGPDPIEALAGLRGDPAGAAVPVILISSRDEEDLGFDCRAAGFSGCLTRPINIFRLFRAVYDSIVFSSGEKRQHLRTPFRERIGVVRGGATESYRATSLSEGGIFIRTREKIDKGETIGIEVPLGFGRPVQLQGEVIYSRKTLGDTDQGETGAAVRFTNLSPEQSSQLTVCILGLLVGDILEDQDEPVLSLVSRTNSLYEDIVAEHIRLGRELKEHQLRMRSILLALPTGVLTYRVGGDGAFELLAANPAAERLLGAGGGEGMGRGAFSPRSWGDDLLGEMRRVAADGGCVERSNVRLERGPLDGYFDFTVFQPAPGLVSVLVSNVTQRKTAEEEGFRLQKLESLGYLAGGIAHDFNNLLQIVSGSVDTAQTLLGTAGQVCPPEKVGRVRYLLGQAQRGVERAATLASQLLTFARGGDPVIQAIDVGPVVSEAVEFTLHGSGVAGRIDLDAGLRRVAGDGGQLHQVFTNIVLNAKQAMPAGGQLFVTGKNVTIGAGHPSLAPGEYVEIAVRDTGVGIPAEILPKVCDPYFTTKQAGSGLGLSNALSIVHKHQGWMSIESAAGSGTTVRVFLPVDAGKPSRAPAVREHRALPRTGSVLLMDDERGLWPVAEEMLGLLGFTTTCVPNGEELLRVYEQARRDGSPYDVVIMDLTVSGGMGGEETIRELLKIDPDARAVVSSGYADAPILARYQEYGFRAALPKPFNGRVLSIVLEELLG